MWRERSERGFFWTVKIEFFDSLLDFVTYAISVIMYQFLSLTPCFPASGDFVRQKNTVKKKKKKEKQQSGP